MFTDLARDAVSLVFDLALEGTAPIAESVTLRDSAKPASAAVVADALFPRLDEVESTFADAKMELRVSQLGTFRIDGAVTVDRSGTQYELSSDTTRPVIVANALVIAYLRAR